MRNAANGKAAMGPALLLLFSLAARRSTIHRLTSVRSDIMRRGDGACSFTRCVLHGAIALALSATAEALLADEPASGKENAFLKQRKPDISVESGPSSARTGGEAARKGLALALVPDEGENPNALTLTPAHVASLREELEESGPLAGAERHQHFQWFEVGDPELELPIVAEHNGKRYGLLPAMADWTMRDLAIQPKVTKVIADSDEDGRWNIGVTADKSSGERIARITSDNVGRRLAVVVDGVIVSAPVLRAQISSAFVIAGDFTQDRAEEIAGRIADASGITVGEEAPPEK